MVWIRIYVNIVDHNYYNDVSNYIEKLFTELSQKQYKNMVYDRYDNTFECDLYELLSDVLLSISLRVIYTEDKKCYIEFDENKKNCGVLKEFIGIINSCLNISSFTCFSLTVKKGNIIFHNDNLLNLLIDSVTILKKKLLNPETCQKTKIVIYNFYTLGFQYRLLLHTFGLISDQIFYEYNDC